MLYEIMKHLRNFFPVENGGVSGSYTIGAGTINLPFVQDEQYFLIEGSVFNDGVYIYPPTTLKSETFDGCITPLAVPNDFLALCEEIEQWQEANASAAVTPYTSESFGGYTYSRATDANGNAIGWQQAFRTRLNTWRKM